MDALPPPTKQNMIFMRKNSVIISIVWVWDFFGKLLPTSSRSDTFDLLKFRGGHFIYLSLVWQQWENKTVHDKKKDGKNFGSKTSSYGWAGQAALLTTATDPELALRYPSPSSAPQPNSPLPWERNGVWDRRGGRIEGRMEKRSPST